MKLDRYLSSAIFAVLITACVISEIYSPIQFIAILIFLVSIPASLEMTKLIDVTGARPWRIGALALTLALVFDGWIGRLEHVGQFSIVALMGTLAWAMARPARGAMASVGATLLAAIWVGIGFAAILALWGWNGPGGDSREGRYLVVFLLPVAMFQDIAAMLAGAKWGRTQLAPVLSPNKTVEGSLGGFFGSILMALIIWSIYWLFTNDERGVPLRNFFAWHDAAILGALFGSVGQLGDLAESLLKREAGVKDSGWTGTGHGGVLDVVDSLLFCAPAMLLYGWARGLWMFSGN
jgi:phosphatidate cytidylyltransferase